MVKTAKTPMDRKKCFKQQLKIHSKCNYKSKNQSNIMTILDSAIIWIENISSPQTPIFVNAIYVVIPRNKQLTINNKIPILSSFFEMFINYQPNNYF